MKGIGIVPGSHGVEKTVFEDPEDDHLAFGHLSFEMESFLFGDGDEDVQGTAFQIGPYEFFVGIGDGAV